MHDALHLHVIRASEKANIPAFSHSYIVFYPLDYYYPISSLSYIWRAGVRLFVVICEFKYSMGGLLVIPCT